MKSAFVCLIICLFDYLFVQQTGAQRDSIYLLNADITIEMKQKTHTRKKKHTQKKNALPNYLKRVLVTTAVYPLDK